MKIRLLGLSIFCWILLIGTVDSFKAPQHVTATKGKFFVHTLHSANFFPSTVKVKWEATLNNKPALPNWLRLLPSRHPEIAYLIGTPVTNVQHVTLHVIAKRLDNFDIQQRMIVINLVEDSLYQGNTQQIFELPVNGLDVEDLVSNRERKITQLENALRNTFRGKNVNPYIAGIRSRYIIPRGKEHIFKNNVGSSTRNILKFRTIVYIGTQQKFYPGTLSIVKNLQTVPDFCTRPSTVVMNKYFAPTFSVDWCNVAVRNISSVEDEMNEKIINENTEEKPRKEAVVEETSDKPEQPPRELYGYSEHGFSIVLVAIILGVCALLIFALVLIFFGSREGQKWRDDKTSGETMGEFVTIRDNQKKLRELSLQRQLLSMGPDTNSTAPSGIHSYLQSRSRAPSTIARFSKSASRLNDREDTIELLPSVDHVPVGKQTVAEAAKQCGSSLHLYRNPLSDESDEQVTESSEDEN
ncbi:CRE-SGCA-1 protein [Caenorhabditis remanei]|uniref:CRE-SGCA-1 protein n=1 Tax=Caenorhabditis remanei TaxID=31234 RepID=E3LDC0_CAERE|nr:CRE-SGCA-1 protein [Caenorhabditis remanei]